MDMLLSAVQSYRHFRGPRVVICPGTGGMVNIELDAAHAAFTSVVGEPRLRVASCACWPGEGDCNQGCLRGIEGTWAREHGLLTRPPETSKPPGSGG